jgi:hypothetical protein
MSIKIKPEQIELIEKHVQSQISEDIKDHYKNFVPTVITRIEIILDQVLSKIKTQIEIKPNQYSYEFSSETSELFFSKDDLNLIRTIFSQNVQLFMGEPRIFRSRYEDTPNALCDGPFKNQQSGFVAKLSWASDNPFIYGQIGRRYQHIPAVNSMTLYQSAQTGKETDFKIKSSQDNECVINAHSLILKLNCVYFESLLNSGLKESDKKTITLDYSPKVLKNMVEFIYCGQIAQSKDLNLDELLELLALSHMIQMTSLFNHTLDLIDDFLKKDMTLDPEQIKNMLASASYFDQEHLTIFALKAADKSPSMDWDNFPKDLIPKLLIKANFHKLKGLEEKLSQFITKGLYLADASA